MGTAHPGGFRTGHGIDHGGCRRNAGQGCHLGDAQLVEGLAEVHLGRRSDPVRALAQKNLVHVERKNLLLRQLRFHEQGDVDFAHLAFHVAPRRQEHVARHLHGDGARALADATRFEIGYGGAQNALPINAMVLEEAIILGCQEGLDQLLRQLFVGDGNPPLVADRRDQLAIAGIDP